jgi:2'-5' RNA ligase
VKVRGENGKLVIYFDGFGYFGSKEETRTIYLKIKEDSP